MEGVLANDQLVKNDASGVDVYFLAIVVSSGLLRGHVNECSSSILDSLVYICLIDLRESKVNDLHGTDIVSSS